MVHLPQYIPDATKISPRSFLSAVFHISVQPPLITGGLTVRDEGPHYRNDFKFGQLLLLSSADVHSFNKGFSYAVMHTN